MYDTICLLEGRYLSFRHPEAPAGSFGESPLFAQLQTVLIIILMELYMYREANLNMLKLEANRVTNLIQYSGISTDGKCRGNLNVSAEERERKGTLIHGSLKWVRCCCWPEHSITNGSGAYCLLK